MTEELKQVGGEAETVAGTQALDGAVAPAVEGSTGSDTVVGQAARNINPPPAGQTDSIKLAPGERFELAANPASVSLTVDGNNLVLGFDLDGNGTPDSFVVLEDLVLAAGGGNPPVLMVAGEPIGVDLLIGNALALSGPETAGPGATLETAAGEPGGLQGSGATTYSDNLGDAIDLLVAQGVIPPVQLSFGLIELEDEIFIAEEDNDPPSADPVLTPASHPGAEGELPPDLTTALSNVILQSATVTIAAPNLPGSVQYVTFTLTEPTAVAIFTDGPTIDPQIYLFVDDGSLDLADLLATDDDDGSPAGSFFNSVINTGDEIGVLPAGNYVVAVSDFSLSAGEAVAGLNDGTDLTGDVTVTVLAHPEPDSILFFKQIDVDGSIGDDDGGIIADFGGADSETSLENLVFTLQSNPTFGQLILVTVGGDTSYLTPGGTFSSEGTVWWIATEDQIAVFLAQPGAPEFLPNVDFTYSVTDEAGGVATAPVVITLPPPTVPRAALGIFQGECLNEDTEGALLFSATPTDGASKISQIIISDFPTGDAADAWVVDASSVNIFGYTFGVDYTASYNATTGELTINFFTANFSLGEGVQGIVNVTPNPDSDVDVTLVIDATAINGVGSATDTESSPIEVDADADGAEGGPGDDNDDDNLSISIDNISDGDDDGESFQAGESGTVTVTATFDDFLDGSETHEFTVTAPAGFTIDDINAASLPLPTGVSYVLAGDGSSITFSVPTDAVDGLGDLTVTLDITNVSAGDGSHTFQASATATETLTGDHECDPEDNTATVSDEELVLVATVAPPVVSLDLYGADDCIEEDSVLNDITNQVAVTVNPDGDDLLTEIVIAGLQPDWIYDFTGLSGAGINVDTTVAGQVTITFDSPSSATYNGTFLVQPPADSDVDHPAITVSASVEDPNDAALTADGSDTIDIHVDANADGGPHPSVVEGVDDGDLAGLSVSVTVADDNLDGDSVFGPNETGSVTVNATFDDFLDGSETHTVAVFMPVGFSYDSSSVTGIPTGTTIDDSDLTKIVFTVPTDALNGTDSFTATFNVTNDSAANGAATFDAEARAVETATGDHECDTEDNTAIAEASDDTTVATVAPPTVVLDLPGEDNCIEEDSTVQDADNVVTLTVTPDGDDLLTHILISGLDTSGDWAYDFTGLDTDGVGTAVTVVDNGDGMVEITFSTGTNLQYVGTFSVQPPADSDVDHPTITATATVEDSADSLLTDSGVGTIDIHVDANADSGPLGSGGVDDLDDGDLSISIDDISDDDASGTFQSGESGTVTVTATFDDYQDGSETHEVTMTAPAGFAIDGINVADLPLPAGVTFDLAIDGSSITFSVPADVTNGLGSLTVTLDITNVSAGEGPSTFEVSATATETTTDDVECDPSDADNIATVSTEQSVTVSGIAAPAVSINLEGNAAYIKEDSEDNVVEFSAATGDATDELSTVVITFPPEVAIGDVDFSTVAGHADVSNVDVDDNSGFGPVAVTITFDAGVTSFSGSFTLDAPDEDSDVDLGSISIVANVQDQADNSQTDSASAGLQIDVDAVLDDALDPGADSDVNETESAGPQIINLGLSASLVSASFVNPPVGGDSGSGGSDDDGSELTSVVLVLDSPLPVGATLGSTAGTVTQDLDADPTGKTYVVTGADLKVAIDGLQVQLLGSFEGSITGTVTVTSKEANTAAGEVPDSGEEPDIFDNLKEPGATFSVTVADGADPTGDELSLTVDEAALDLEQDGDDLVAGTTFGNNAGSTAETNSGGLTFSAGADPIVDISFGDTVGITVVDESGNTINVAWSGSGTDTLTGTLNGVTVIVLSLSGDNAAAAGGTANVTVTATLTDALQHDFGNTGNVSITGIEVDAEDDDGDTGTSVVDVTVLDDEPSNISPETAALGSSAGSTFTGDLDLFDNVGADKPGDVVFDPSLQDAILLEDDGITAVTSNGDSIILNISDVDHLLTGYVESGDNVGYQEGEDTKVFTVQLNPDAVIEGDDEYTVALFDEIDTGGGLLFDNFSDVDAGGPKEFIALDDPRTGAEDLGEDILITASPESELVNASTQGVGVQNQQVDAGETIRVDFVSNVVGLTDATPGIKDDFVNLIYSGHRTVNDSGFNISQDFGPTTVTVKAIDADDDKDFGGDADDVQRTITLVTVISATGVVLLDHVAANASTGGVSVVFNGDGTATVSGLLVDYQVLVTSDGGGYDALEITAVGSKFDLGGIVTSSAQAGEPVGLNFDVVASDEDGDTSSGAIQVAVLPQIDGGDTADNLLAGSNGGNIQAGGGNDTLVGGAANDLLQGEGGADTISDGDGNDTTIGGDGADVINLAADGVTDILVYDTASEAGDVVTGFDVSVALLDGVGGDVIDVVDLLDAGDFTGASLSEAMADGYVTLTDNLGNAEIWVDADGSAGGGAAVLVATLNGINVADLNDNIVVD